MTDCTKYRELLSAYADDMLPPSDRALLEEHLAVCPNCQEELTELRELISETRALETDVPQGFEKFIITSVEKDKKRRRTLSFSLIRPLAAAAVFFIVIAGATYLLRDTSKKTYDAAAPFAEDKAESTFDIKYDVAEDQEVSISTVNDDTGEIVTDTDDDQKNGIMSVLPDDLLIEGKYKTVYITASAAAGALDTYEGSESGEYKLYIIPAESADILYKEGSLGAAEIFSGDYDFIDSDSETALIAVLLSK